MIAVENLNLRTVLPREGEQLSCIHDAAHVSLFLYWDTSL